VDEFLPQLISSRPIERVRPMNERLAGDALTDWNQAADADTVALLQEEIGRLEAELLARDEVSVQRGLGRSERRPSARSARRSTTSAAVHCVR